MEIEDDEIKITAMLAVAGSVNRWPYGSRSIGRYSMFAVCIRRASQHRMSVGLVDLRCPNCTFTSTHCFRFHHFARNVRKHVSGHTPTDRPTEKGKMKNEVVRAAFIFASEISPSLPSKGNRHTYTCTYTHTHTHSRTNPAASIPHFYAKAEEKLVFTLSFIDCFFFLLYFFPSTLLSLLADGTKQWHMKRRWRRRALTANERTNK